MVCSHAYPNNGVLSVGDTCELVVTDAGVSLFLQKPGGGLPAEFDWAKGGGAVEQARVPASAPRGGTPCALADWWVVTPKGPY